MFAADLEEDGQELLRAVWHERVRKRRGRVVETEVTGEQKPWRLRGPSKADRDQLLGVLQELAPGNGSGPA